MKNSNKYFINDNFVSIMIHWLEHFVGEKFFTKPNIIIIIIIALFNFDETKY